MGGRIKGFAVAIMVIGIIACVICFIVGAVQYNKDKKYIEYASVNGGSYYSSLEEAGNRAYAGKMLKIYGIIGIVSCIVGGLPYYWCGCLFESVEYLQDKIEKYEETNARAEKTINHTIARVNYLMEQDKQHLTT